MTPTPMGMVPGLSLATWDGVRASVTDREHWANAENRSPVPMCYSAEIAPQRERSRPK